MNMASSSGTAGFVNATARYCRGVLVETPDQQTLLSDIVRTGNGFMFVDPTTRMTIGVSVYRPNCHIVVQDDVTVKLKDTNESLRVNSTPHFQSQGYFLAESRVPRSSMYPRSPEGGFWYEHVLAGTRMCSFLVQKIEASSYLWLTVLDTERGDVLAAHPLRPHEFAAIWMREDAEVSREAWNHAGPDDAEAARRQILSVLDEPKPSDLSRLWTVIRGAEVLVDTKGATMRGLVDPLVPESLAEEKEIRDEFKAFLAMAVLEQQLDADPVNLSNALLPTRTLRGLLAAHFRYRLDGKETPPYAKVLLDAARHRLQIQDATRHEKLKPHEVAWLHIAEDSPDWTSRTLKYCGRSHDCSSPSIWLPVTKEQAAADIELRKDRAALAFMGYNLRTVVHTQAIGLEQVLFRGSAHSWPHKHLAWSAVLGPLEGGRGEKPREIPRTMPGKNPSTLQLLTLPEEALSELRGMIDESTRQNWRMIDWRARSYNPELYDSRINQWTASFWNTVKSEIPELSLNRLKTRLDPGAPSCRVTLDRPSARALDITSSHFYLELLESERFLRDYRIDPVELESILQRLCKARVISIQHIITMSRLPSIAIDLQGEEKTVCGLALAIIGATPATSSWFSAAGREALLVTFLPEQYVLPTAKHITHMADALNVESSVDEVTSYSGYLNDMYQRLLRTTDNTWDADISDLVSQFSFADSPQAPK